MLFLISVILLLVVIGLLACKDPRNGILLLLPSMGVIASTWNISFAGLSLIKLTYALVAIIMFFRLRKRTIIVQLPRWWRVTAFFFAMASVFGVIWSPIYFSFNAVLFIDLILRALNFYLGFFLFPAYFRTQEDFKRLLYALVITAAFPLLVEYYQIFTGTVFHLRQTRGLTRYVGLYHDAATNKIFYQQALIAIFLLIGYHLETVKVKKILLVGFSGLILIGCYFIFSKSMVAFLLLWTIGLAVLGKKVHWAILAVLFVVIADLCMGGKIFENVYRIFERDINIQKGIEDQKYLLSGRGMIWQDDLVEFKDFGILAYLFGAGWTPPAHNEWLRVFFLGGICSVVVFIGCQVRILFHIVNLYLRQRKFHLFVALMIFGSYLLDCLGIVPGLYPSYNWFLWGMLGCLITQGSDFYAPIVPNHPTSIPLVHETQQGT